MVQPQSLRSPKVIIGEKNVDIWNFGCLVSSCFYSESYIIEFDIDMNLCPGN